MVHRNHFVFVWTTLCLSTCLAITTSIKRQGVPGEVQPPARDLLPPPALSASFPTLRPNNGRPGQSPQVNLIPPFRPLGDKGIPRPPPPQPSANNNAPTTESTLLAPIEIPPAKPLTDAEIAELFRESSFVPTTGQGVGANESRKSSKIAAEPQPQPQELHVPVPVQPTPAQRITSSVTTRNSVNSTTLPNTPNTLPRVKFPDSPPPGIALSQLCPVCECTPEVDYICGSNGVIYLNSCSFDCATFCETGLRKVSLEFCSLPNHL